MTKAPDLSPLALSLVDKLIARLPANVSDLETWWERQGKVTRLELRRILRQLDGDRLVYDRDAGMAKPLDLVTARAGRGGVKAGDLVVMRPGTKAPHLLTVTTAVEPSPQVRAAVSTRARRHAGTSTPIISEKMLKASTPAVAPRTITTLDGKTIAVADGPTVGRPAITVTEAPTPAPAAPVVVPTVTPRCGATGPRIDGKDHPCCCELGAGHAGPHWEGGMLWRGAWTTQASPAPPPVTANVGGVTFTGSAAAVKAATEAYQRTLLAQPTTPRSPAKRGPQPSAGSVAERVRASVCRKPGTVAEVIARFPDVNPNTVRGALGTLKSKGLVGHTGGKYGAPRG